MKAVILIEEGVEDLEFFYPYFRFLENGIEIDVAGPHSHVVKGKHGYEVKSNIPLAGAKPNDYDAVILPGGRAPEKLRNHPTVIELIKGMFAEDKIIASICHGAQILVSAEVLRGKKATCVKKIKDDIIAAGADYEDKEVVVDDNLITSRGPDDLPAFCREIFKAVKA